MVVKLVARCTSMIRSLTIFDITTGYLLNTRRDRFSHLGSRGGDAEPSEREAERAPPQNSADPAVRDTLD